MEDWLFDQGFDVLTPNFEGSEVEVSAMHRKNLQICDGVLVYFGAGTKAWVEMKLMDVRQAPGYGRDKPILVKTVYVAPPDDRRKARFRTHAAEVVRQEGAGLCPDLLGTFAHQVRENVG